MRCRGRWKRRAEGILLPPFPWFTYLSAPDYHPSLLPPPPQCVQVGMVLDLTNSSRFYRFEAELPDAEKREIFYRKVRQPGGGGSAGGSSARRCAG